MVKMEKTYPDIRLFIDGKWRDKSDHQPIIDPSNEEVIGRLPVATGKDLDDALDAAQNGLKIWKRTSPMERARIIQSAARLMRERQEQIACSISMELGKPIQQSRLEVIRGCEFFEWDAAEGQRLYGRTIPAPDGIRYTVVRQPIGCVAAFSPWNFPMSQPARKIAGALAAGCSVILKPAEETPAGAVHIAQAFHDAGLPPGVLNLVFGLPEQISTHLIPDPSIRLVAFTGSTYVGKKLTLLAFEHMTPVLMELGGHAPVIVCDDVNPQESGVACASRKMRNAGQVCTSPTRFYIDEKIYQPFKESFIRYVQTIRVGHGLDEDAQMGPVAHKGRLAALQDLTDDAIAHGAKLITGGQRQAGKGYFFAPTILSEVPDEARIMQEEPFGPIAILNPVSNLQEAIDKANSTEFGLAAYALTHSAANVDKLTNEIEAGNLSINTLEASVPETPFGGVKSSGYGREGGSEGLLHYTNVKNIMHSMKI